MSADYTDDEVEAAVERIVRSAIRRPYGALGQRALGTTFADFQEQTIAVLTLTPNAPFYVVLLGTERLVTNISDLSSTLEDLDAAVRAIGRASTPVASTTDLANARVAADALAISAGARSQAYPNIAATPAFQRLDRNISAFLSAYSAPNLKQGQSLVRTPEEGKAMLPGLIQQLETQRQTLIDKVTGLANAIADYEALNLPALLSTGVVQRAAVVLSQRTTQLATLTPETRVSVIRDVTLDLLAARAIIRNFGSLATPTTFLILTGTGVLFADATHPAIPAMLTADLPGPYPVRVDSTVENQLNLTIDGTFQTVVTTAGSFIAELQGIALEPFAIIDSSDPEENDTLEILVDELGTTTSLVVTLTPGFRSAQQIVADILAAVTTEPIFAEPALVPIKFQGKVDISGSDPSAVTFTSTNSFTDFARVGVVDGDKLRVLSGANIDELYQVNVSGVAGAVLTCTRLTGTGTAIQVGELIEVGGASFAVRVKLPDSYAVTALANRTRLTIGTPGDAIKSRTAGTLGFSPGIFATSAALPAQNVADAINAATTTATNDTSRLKASLVTRTQTVGGELMENFSLRSDSSSPALAVLYRYRGRGTSTAGTTPTFTLAGLQALAIVKVGDELVIRMSTTAADVNARGVVTATAGDTVTATFGSAVTAGTNLLVEISPDLTTLPLDSLLVIPSGSNAGSYQVTAQGAIKAELSLDKALRSFLDTSGQPIFMTGSLVQEYLTLTSTDVSLASAIEVNDGSPTNPNSGAQFFFTTRPASAIATAVWFELPDGTKGMEVGDMLELYLSNVTTPTHASVITVIDGELVSFSPGIPTILGSFAFDVGSGLPFARIRKTRRDTFDTFSEDAKLWLGLPEFQPAWLIELDRLVTIATTEPSPTNVASLRNFLIAMYATLTEAALTTFGDAISMSIEGIAEAYTAPVIPEVDALVASLESKGGDRAIDLLLDGHFQDYFGLTVDTVSYAGTVASAARDVVRSDLPVRSTRRSELTNRQISLGATTDADYEFDQSDIDNSLVPDSPGPNPPPKPGDAF